eukprot:8231963-Ditylum_brightwellii.AAC.1
MEETKLQPSSWDAVYHATTFFWAANSVTFELVLEGDYSNSELGFLQQQLLEYCKKEHNTALIGEEVQIHEWKDKIKV